MSSYLDKLKSLPNCTDEKALGNPAGAMAKQAFSGMRHGVVYLCTEDFDGQIELSLSLQGLRRQSSGHAEAFFRWLGVAPLSQEKTQRHTLHFVMPPVSRVVQ